MNLFGGGVKISNYNTTISFLMMARNVEAYIGAAIGAISEENVVSWELIVVDDHSEDGTYSEATKWADLDDRVRVFKNPGRGKVVGTSFAFTKAQGDYVKCIDSDDIICSTFFRVFEKIGSYEVLFHATRVVDENLNPIADYFPNSVWLEGGYADVVSVLASLPKFSWTFSRRIAEKVFPLPEALPFEDVWISIILKKHSKAVNYVPLPLYLYRQHQSNTFNGILNFSRKAVEFRAKRLLKLMDVLEQEKRVMHGLDSRVFSAARLENKFLLGDAKLSRVLTHEHLLKRVPRLLVMKYAPPIASALARARWRYERFRQSRLTGELL